MTEHGTVNLGHKDHRRTIYDVLTNGDAGGGHTLYNLALFSPLNPGAAIGGHYHKAMWETYLIVSGSGYMDLLDTSIGKSERLMITENMLPFRFVIPPGIAHRFTASDQVMLLIAATGPQSSEDTFAVAM